MNEIAITIILNDANIIQDNHNPKYCADVHDFVKEENTNDHNNIVANQNNDNTKILTNEINNTVNDSNILKDNKFTRGYYNNCRNIILKNVQTKQNNNKEDVKKIFTLELEDITYHFQVINTEIFF